jgi:hypothetical protein
MVGFILRRFVAGIFLLSAFSLLSSVPAQAALGTPPGAEERILQVGLGLVADETISTGPTGQTHLLFVDGSTISIGPNSSLSLDKFVYDPKVKKGELVVSVSKGLFRFVGGRISKKTPVLFKSPTAVIGIRGGVAIVQVNSPAQIQQAQNRGQNLPPASATMLFGDQVTMRSGGQQQTMTRPGFTVTQTSGGGVSTPQPTTQAQLTQVLSGLEDPQTPPGGDNGDGGPQTPQQLAAIAPAAGGGVASITNDDVSDNQVSGLNSDQTPNIVNLVVPITALDPIITTTTTVASIITTDASQTPLPICTEPGQTGCIEPVEETAQVTTESSASSGSLTAFVGAAEPFATIGVPGGLTLAGNFSGRVKYATNPALGTDDGNAAFNLSYQGATLIDGFFSTGNFSALIDDIVTNSDGSRDFSVLSLGNPFGAFGAPGFVSRVGELSGTGFIAPNDDFLFYGLEDQVDGQRVFGWAGIPYTGALPTSGATFYDLQNDFVLGSMIPFVNATSGGALTPNYGIGEGDSVIMWDVSNAPSAQRAFGHMSLSVRDGQAGEAISLILGEVLLDENGRPFISGEMRGSSRLAPGQLTHQFNGYVASQDDDSGFDFFGATGPSFFSLEGAIANETTDAQTQAGVVDQFGDLANNFAVQPNNVAIPIAETLDPRTSRNMIGYTSGIFQPTLNDASFSSTAVFETFLTNPLGVRIRTSAETNKIQGYIKYNEMGFSSEDTQLFFGDLDSFAFGDEGVTSGQSIFVDDGGYGAIEAATQFSQTNGDPITTENLYLVSSGAADFPAGTLPTGVSMCDCQYLNWGFWGGSVYRAAGEIGFYREDFHLATWVVGDVQDMATISGMTGTATYSGHVIGSVSTPAGVRTRIGNLAYSLDFSNRTFTDGGILFLGSNGSITNFDGGNYDLGTIEVQSVTESMTGDRHRFSGAISAATGTDASRTGGFTGSFMAGGGDGAAEMGGQFNIAGTDYQSAGIFAGKKTLEP